MKTFLAACALLLLMSASAEAGDLAVAANTLDSMGLGSMQTMSDTEGLAVRGKALDFGFGNFGSFGSFGSGSFGSLFGSPEATDFANSFGAQLGGIKPAFFNSINGMLPSDAQIPFPF